MEWFVLLAAILVGIALLMSWTAGRVDRLHHRVERTSAVLDAELFHRSGAAVELAASGLLDPASSLVLLDAAHEARAGEGAERQQAESELSRALMAALDSADEVARLQWYDGADELLHDLGNACRKVELARRFHNDAVVSASSLRRTWPVRWLGLAGHAPLPNTVELDDSWPAALP